MDWWRIISLLITYGPKAAEIAAPIIEKYGPLALDLFKAVTPVITKAVSSGTVAGDSVVAKVNDALIGIGQPQLTSDQAVAVEKLWMDRASGAPSDGFAGFG